ncbi:5-methylcytosine-specific restriction protein A [Pseudogracilibacillus auburnensis]|uniref:Putative HNH nuclease YajD n=2 Tax=Pseudogracilibacillus auburnensis TaxID=1494959 RepID=A0A2V3WJ58_9BACI|nr:HNH endonuclease [Pseudogracilibacillus auburnensis]PXW88809.1 5-methylcytosine-specific restriction protein A [Pseudogracilibacillus auburnensis]
MQVNRNETPKQKPLKPCREIGCRNLTRKTYCKIHEKNKGETMRNYNKYGRDPVVDSFYKSRAWQRVRRLAYERDNGLCQRCKSNGHLVKADVVHHIVEVKTDWDQRLELDNLESLCHSCHNKEHK